MNNQSGNIPLPKKNGGFTLLEIMVSIAIMSIVLISIYKMQSQTIAMNHMSRFYSTAPLLAQQILNKVKANAKEAPSSNSGDFGNNFPGYNWNVTVSDVESDLLGNSAQNLKKIDVLVTFDQAESSYNLRAYWNFWE